VHESRLVCDAVDGNELWVCQVRASQVSEVETAIGHVHLLDGLA
jgi:Zn finger protein HypA/HybF involved in hydrogenase expression